MAKKAGRYRRCTFPAEVTAETETPFVVGANLVQATSGLAGRLGQGGSFKRLLVLGYRQAKVCLPHQANAFHED